MIDWLRTHKHSFALLYFVVYLVAFAALERLVVPQYILHVALDDALPFNEWFVIPYLSWLLWMPGMLLYFLMKSRADFLRLCFLMFSGMTVCLVIYALLPNAVDLRREITGDNLLCRLVLWLRATDTPTNVCPSIHVSSTVAIAMVVNRSALFRGRGVAKAVIGGYSLLICLSTLFLQQHSVVDLLCGWALSAVLGIVTFRTGWLGAVDRLRSRNRERMRKRRMEKRAAYSQRT